MENDIVIASDIKQYTVQANDRRERGTW
jgi:hypothetical protein